MEKIYFGNDHVNVSFDTGDLSFKVSFKENVFCSDNKNPAYFIDKKKKKVLFTEAKNVEHNFFKTGVGDGVRTKYSNFISKGVSYNFEFETYIWLEYETGYLRFELIPIKEKKFEISYIRWPAPVDFEFSENGYAILPIMQGVMIPDISEQNVKTSLEGRMYGRDASMPWWGQTNGQNGYMTIVETAWDAEYDYLHLPKKSTSIAINWIGSLGKIDYRRKITLRFFEKCNYVTFCKEYRRYLIENGNFVSLKEKIVKNPKVQQLIGNPIIHTDSIHWNCEPESEYYNYDNPKKNFKVQSFSDMAQKIEKIKKIGIKKAYVHIDGWGKSGYDNLHPDILPPSQPAGGYEGMKDMLERIKNIGYIPALHDQYRDYYIKAETYNENQAVLSPEGDIHTCAIWPGGKQSMLCAQVAPYYIKRNYSKMKKMGLEPEGVYLDVFSAVEPDECDNSIHKMTRKECIEKRCECFEMIRSMGMIVSSEEGIDIFASCLDIVHHSPYAYAMWESVNIEPFGIPIPLFNLVYHDSLLIPWGIAKGGWGIPKNHSGMLHAILNGGMPYLSINPSKEEFQRIDIVLKLHKKVAKSEMISHTFLQGSKSKQETRFSCNTSVFVDFDSEEYKICWPDGSVDSGKVNDK